MSGACFRLSLCTLLVAMVPARAAGQLADRPLTTWHHTSWTGEEGPPRPGNYLMAMSADGYLWLSARGSLIRFDGARFRVFDSTSTPALRATRTGEFVPGGVDSAGVMWIYGPDGALISYDAGRFQVVTGPNPRAGQIMQFDGHGRPMIRAPDLRILRNGRLEQVALPPGVPDSTVWGMVADTGSGVWLGTTDNGLLHVVGDSVERLGTGAIRALLQSADGAVWAIGTGLGRGVWRFDGQRWSQLLLPGSGESFHVRSAYEGADGSIWFPSNVRGLLRWRDGTIERFGTAEGLSSERLTSPMVLDRDGAVWVSTDAGIDRVRPSSFTLVDSARGRSLRNVESMAPDASGALWVVSTRPEILLLDSGAVRGRAGLPVADRFAVSDREWGAALFAGREGGVWLASRAPGVVHRTRTSARVLPAHDLASAAGAVDGFEARDGNILVRFGRELRRLRGGAFERLPRSPCPAPTVAGALAEDAAGLVWLSCDAQSTLRVLHGDSVVAEVSLPDSAARVVRIVPEAGDTLWVTSRSALFRVTGRRVVEVPLRGADDLLGGFAQVIAAHGRLWLANTEGIAHVPLAELHRAAERLADSATAVRVDALDGIPDPRLSRLQPRALQLGADGRLWILTRSGLAVTDGAFEERASRAPMPRVDGVSVGGVSLSLEERADLPVDPDRVEFDFSAPHPALAERVRMEYRLDGVDRQWRPDTLARRAAYTQLRPGRYVFRVRAWSPDGTQRSDEASLSFRVRASWYQSAWFIALAFLTFGALIFAGTIELQRRRARIESARMRRDFDVVLSERARIARELHDTLLQGFAGITLHLEGVRGKLAQDHPASGTLTDVVGRAESALREARAMVWDIRSPGHGEIEVIDALRKVGLEALAGRDIALHCVEEGQRRPLTAEIEQTLLRVAGEAVANAARHADPRDVAIVLSYERTRVVLEVRDDGRGDEMSRFESAAAAGHFGVVGMHERARRAGGTLVVRSAPGEGTIIRLTLPTPWLP